MNSPVVTAHKDDTIRDIAIRMKDQRVGSIIISENEKPVGIITDWDIVINSVINDVKPGTIKASTIMQPLHTIESEDNITDALEC